MPGGSPTSVHLVAFTFPGGLRGGEVFSVESSIGVSYWSLTPMLIPPAVLGG